MSFRGGYAPNTEWTVGSRGSEGKMKAKKYHVRDCALGKFTATTKPNSERAASRDYRTFDTREEAEAWAKEQNSQH